MHSLKNYNANIHVTPVQVKKPNIAATREAPGAPSSGPSPRTSRHPTLHLVVTSPCFLPSVIVPHMFTTLIFLKSTGHLLRRMFLNLGLSEVSQRLDWGYTFLAKPHRIVPFSVQYHQLVHAILTSWSLNASGVFSWLLLFHSILWQYSAPILSCVAHTISSTN